MKISVLTDDKAKKRGFLGEHGLSLYIEYEKQTVLFDTGQSDVFRLNARTMGLPLDKVDFIVLSHGHYDHCGGLIRFPFSDSGACPRIFAQREAFEKKYAVNPDGGSFREIGIPWSPADCDAINSRLILLEGMIRITPGIILLGNIPACMDFEENPGVFYKQNRDSMRPDGMTDEQMLVFDTEKGLAVLLGCSHPGIINCLNHVRKMFPGKKIDTLAAGMHLENCSDFRLRMTIKHLLDFDIRNIFPLHCTGICAISEMRRQLGGRCHVLYSGDSAEV